MRLMAPLQLDFVQRRRPSLAGSALLLAGLIALTAGWQSFQQGNEALRSTEQQLAKYQPKPRKPAQVLRQQPIQADPVVEQRLEHARQIADFLLLPWMEVFAALEAAADPEVALLGIEPEPKKKLVKITAESKNKAVMFAYMQKLEATPQLHGVYLQRHEITEEEDQHPVRFSLVASWDKSATNLVATTDGQSDSNVDSDPQKTSDPHNIKDSKQSSDTVQANPAPVGKMSAP